MVIMERENVESGNIDKMLSKFAVCTIDKADEICKLFTDPIEMLDREIVQQAKYYDGLFA